MKYCLRVATKNGYIEYMSRSGKREWVKGIAQNIADHLNAKDGSIVYLVSVGG